MDCLCGYLLEKDWGGRWPRSQAVGGGREPGNKRLGRDSLVLPTLSLYYL